MFEPRRTSNNNQVCFKSNNSSDKNTIASNSKLVKEKNNELSLLKEATNNTEEIATEEFLLEDISNKKGEKKEVELERDPELIYDSEARETVHY